MFTNKDANHEPANQIENDDFSSNRSQGIPLDPGSSCSGYHPPNNSMEFINQLRVQLKKNCSKLWFPSGSQGLKFKGFSNPFGSTIPNTQKHIRGITRSCSENRRIVAPCLTRRQLALIELKFHEVRGLSSQPPLVTRGYIWVCLKIVYPYTQWLMILIPNKWL